jgi:hypothetical protein
MKNIQQQFANAIQTDHLSLEQLKELEKILEKLK